MSRIKGHSGKWVNHFIRHSLIRDCGAIPIPVQSFQADLTSIRRWGFYVDYDSGYNSRGLGWVITQACDDSWPESACNRYWCPEDGPICTLSPPHCTISRNPIYDCPA